MSSHRSPRVRTWLASLAATCALAACGRQAPNGPAGATPAPTPATHANAENVLPNGARAIFPAYRVVAFYGLAGDPSLGVLGAGSPDDAARRLLRQAKAYASRSRPVLPAFELIATVAQASSNTGTYNGHVDDASIRRYLAAARKIHALLILDVQPGRANVLREVRRYEKLLAEPDVGLALDSEWTMAPGEIPGQVFGGTDATTVNAVSTYLATVVQRNQLPQKLFVVHQFTAGMIAHRDRVAPRRGLAIVFHVDGFGGRAAKLSKYHQLAVTHSAFFNGFKLFYRQDVDMFSAREVLRMQPPPDLVTYE
jgi:hypothetical protein